MLLPPIFALAEGELLLLLLLFSLVLLKNKEEKVFDEIKYIHSISIDTAHLWIYKILKKDFRQVHSVCSVQTFSRHRIFYAIQ